MSWGAYTYMHWSQSQMKKVLHVAAVAAELLDNNEDGFIDDPIIGRSCHLSMLLCQFLTLSQVQLNNFLNFLMVVQELFYFKRR